MICVQAPLVFDLNSLVTFGSRSAVSLHTFVSFAMDVTHLLCDETIREVDRSLGIGIEVRPPLVGVMIGIVALVRLAHSHLALGFHIVGYGLAELATRIVEMVHKQNVLTYDSHLDSTCMGFCPLSSRYMEHLNTMKEARLEVHLVEVPSCHS